MKRRAALVLTGLFAGLLPMLSLPVGVSAASAPIYDIRVDQRSVVVFPGSKVQDVVPTMQFSIALPTEDAKVSSLITVYGTSAAGSIMEFNLWCGSTAVCTRSGLALTVQFKLKLDGYANTFFGSNAWVPLEFPGTYKWWFEASTDFGDIRYPDLTLASNEPTGPSVTFRRATSLTLNAAPEPIERGDRVTVSGYAKVARTCTTLNGTCKYGYAGWFALPSRTVSVYFDRDGATPPQLVATPTTNSSGYFSIRPTQQDTGSWYAVLPVTTRTAATTSPRDSVSVYGNDTRLVSFDASPEPTASGEKAQITGKLQRLGLDGAWKPVDARDVRIMFDPSGPAGAVQAGTARTGADGVFRLSRTQWSSGEWYASFPGGTYLAAATSARDYVGIQLKCEAYSFIGVRGSGEADTGLRTDTAPYGMGWRVADIYNGWKQQMASLGTSTTLVRPYGLSYPAAGTENLYNDVPTATSGFTYFFWSAEDGISELRLVLLARHEACPGEKFVLAGYSQGAWVINNTLQWIQTKMPSLDESVAAVALIADPTRVANEAAPNLGSADPGAEGIATARSDVLLTLGYDNLGRDGRIPESFVARTLTVCDQYDIICDSSADAIAQHISGNQVHSHNYDATRMRTVGTILAGRTTR